MWVDYLATDLGIPIRNFAFSSASTLDVSRQVRSYLRSRERQGFTGADPDALYVSIDWSYGADKTRALFGLDTEVELPGPAANIDTLADSGAQTFITGRILWAIENSPFWRSNRQARSDVRKAEEQFLADLSTLTDSRKIQVYHADLNALAERVMQDPSAFGLVNYRDTLPVSPVANPDVYVWMPDGRHLTTAYNRIIADEVLAVIAVPEPSAMGLYACDVLSASWLDSKIAWYENVDGNGSFGPRHIIATADGRALSVRAADLDGDGNSDVLWSGIERSVHAADLVDDVLWLGEIVWSENLSGKILAGDANRDFKFDQLDFVQVLQSAKYATGEPATFGEGDWNGDGVFNQLDIIAALATDNYLQGPYAAVDLLFDGDAP